MLQKPKNKMQNVHFGSIDEFLNYLPDDELKLTETLRKLILDCVPTITEKLWYNVAYYKGFKGMFFLWPASVLWGKKQSHKGVRFGFQQGYLLTDEEEYLDKGGRKQVYWRDYASLKEIDFELLRFYIYEAAAVDDMLRKKK